MRDAEGAVEGVVEGIVDETDEGLMSVTWIF